MYLLADAGCSRPLMLVPKRIGVELPSLCSELWVARCEASLSFRNWFSFYPAIF